MNKIMEIRNLKAQYGRYEALRDINFSVNKGDFIGIVGPNGSGKTTLIKCLLGLKEPSSGSIHYINSLESNRPQIGYLPQNATSNESAFPAKVKEIVAIGLLSQRKSRFYLSSDEKNRIESIMIKLNIYNLKDKKIGNLSGGQKQRVLLARALVSSSEILIMDEPTSALDPKVKEEFYKLLQKLNEEDKTTIILISHDVDSIGKYTNKMMYLDRRLMFFGTSKAFRKFDKMANYSGNKSQIISIAR